MNNSITINANIIVVDDDAQIGNLLRVSLTNEGYVVDVFQDGISALESINNKEYDLAILDVMMPEMDGYTLCSKIRETKFFPILMVTAKGNDLDKITGLMMGADDYIVKPFNPLEIVINLKSIVYTHSDVYWQMSRFYSQGRLYLIYGNHDIVKKNSDYVSTNLCECYDETNHCEVEMFPDIEIRESILLVPKEGEKNTLLLHGHQADPLNSTF